ncbi:MAG: hypothetical protein ACOC28_08155 [Alkalispirochaetaceae bacterium]
MSVEEEKERLADGLGRFFHRELDRRYNREHLRSIPEIRESGLLEDLPQEYLDRIGEFFKRVMYPVGAKRRARNEGVETVEAILTNTPSLLALLPKAAKVLLGNGPKLPKVARAGLTVVSAYRLARRMEDKVLSALLEIIEDDGSRKDPEKIPEESYRRAEAAVSVEESSSVFEATEKIVRLGMDLSLMETTTELLEVIRESRRDPGERESLAYVTSVVEEVRSLALDIDRESVDRILQLSRLNEEHYWRSLEERYANR